MTYRGPDRLAAARRPGGARGGPPVAVRQQLEADRPGDAQLPLDQRPVPDRPVAVVERGQPRRLPRLRRLDRVGRPGDAPAVHGAEHHLQHHQLQLPGGYNYGSYANGTAWTTVINSFLCPSDGNAGNGRPGIGTGTPATNSYKGSVGTTTAPYWANNFNGPVTAAAAPTRSTSRVASPVALRSRLGCSATGSLTAFGTAPTDPRTPSRTPSPWQPTPAHSPRSSGIMASRA